MTEKKNPLRAVFDFDGTLIDSRDVKTANYLRAFEKIFRSGIQERELIISSCERTTGANRFIQLRDTLETLGMEASEADKEAWSRAYSALNSRSLAKIPEFPSVRRVLAELKDSGHPLYAASGILEEEFLREISKRKLGDYFLEIKGGDKLGFLKELINRSPDTVLFVGDTGYDEKTAEEAGALFYRITCNRDFENLPRFILRIDSE